MNEFFYTYVNNLFQEQLTNGVIDFVFIVFHLLILLALIFFIGSFTYAFIKDETNENKQAVRQLRYESKRRTRKPINK